MRSSIFTSGEEVSQSFADALNEVHGYAPVTEETVHVQGYGMVTHDQAKHEATKSSVLADEHSAKGNHGGAAYYHERAAMFHKALHQHAQKHGVTESVEQIDELSKKTLGNYVKKASYDAATKANALGSGDGTKLSHVTARIRGVSKATDRLAGEHTFEPHKVGQKVVIHSPGNHHHGMIGTVKQRVADPSKTSAPYYHVQLRGRGGIVMAKHKLLKPLLEGAEDPKLNFGVGDKVQTSSGSGEVVEIAGGEDGLLKYLVKLHHSGEHNLFGEHEIQKVSVHEAAQPQQQEKPGYDMGRVEGKYKRAQARGYKAKDKEKHQKKWMDEEHDILDEAVIAENENAIRHNLTVTSGSSGKGNSLNTSHPEKHWLVGEHMKGTSPTHYMRVHVQHPFDPSKSYHTVISGYGGGEGYEPGHHVKIHDDGNGNSHFPKHKYVKSHPYAPAGSPLRHQMHQQPGTGTHGIITHVAKHGSEMKNWPHSGRISFHVLK